MSSLEEFKDYLADFDNCDVEGFEKVDNAQEKLWRNLVLDAAMWKTLKESLFEDEALTLFFTSATEEERQLYFCFGVQCMISFVQANFTGPDLPQSMEAFFKSNIFQDVDYNKYLSLNNEDINVNTKYSLLLYAAKRIFLFCHVQTDLNIWWQLRSIIIHQRILDELSQVLLSQTDALCKEVKDLQIEKRLQAQFEIEKAQLYGMFRSITKVQAHLETARNLLGVHHELKGRLGKRTKHQTQDLAQLTLEVSLTKEEDVERPPVLELNLPTNIILNDDVRLDLIKFKDETDAKAALPDLEQKVLLSIVDDMLMSRPLDELYYEEIKPYLDLILSQTNTWAVRMVCLFVRIKLESCHKRTIERSLCQCEELVKEIYRPNPHFLNRISGVYSTNFQPKWKAEANLAKIMYNLGLIKGSLDICMRLQLWEEVIVCYGTLQMRHQAAEIIKQQLEVTPTVKLWCLLGDAMDDPTCYEKAWDFSKKRSSRAQRHWALYLYKRQQYQQSIPHFEKSVSINPLQPAVWLRYAYAALEIENWQAAATAYRRYTSLEPGNFESWNNLAKAYIKLGNKRGAHQALHDALKCSYDNWKVWDNYMAVSADIAHFSDVIFAYHRILDLKGKHLDVEVLSALVYGVCTNVNDSEGISANRLMQKTRELLGRVTSLYPTDGHVWELYAGVAPGPLLKAQRLQRALRNFMSSGWEKNNVSCQQVLYVCHKLAEVALNDQVEATDSLLNSVRLCLTSALTTIKRQEYDDLNELILEVDKCLVNVLDKNKQGITKTDVKNT